MKNPNKKQQQPLSQGRIYSNFFKQTHVKQTGLHVLESRTD